MNAIHYKMITIHYKGIAIHYRRNAIHYRVIAVDYRMIATLCIDSLDEAFLFKYCIALLNQSFRPII